MSERIGPTWCGECGDGYGHDASCSRSVANRPPSLVQKLENLQSSKQPDSQRLQVLILLVKSLAKQLEDA